METTLQNERERQLWKQAKKRVGFKRQLAAYMIVNTFLWVLWFIGDKNETITSIEFAPWPLWCTLGWGIGLVFSYFDAFVFNKPDSIEREFEKLKGKI
ncbi:MAG: 2TM domain-containing protein [Bacteroidota bacterium]|nr:2TM domain-containing protein [Bacteroidota bacterium]